MSLKINKKNRHQDTTEMCMYMYTGTENVFLHVCSVKFCRINVYLGEQSQSFVRVNNQVHVHVHVHMYWYMYSVQLDTCP